MIKSSRVRGAVKALWKRWFDEVGSSSEWRRKRSRFEAGRSTIDEALARISALQSQYEATQTFALEQQRLAFWLRRVAVELSRPVRGWRGWLPYRVRRRQVVQQLERLTIFDSGSYLGRYPDVAVSGIDPLYHFLKHGLDEGRDDAVDFGEQSKLILDQRSRTAVLASGLFDPEWYASIYGVEGNREELLDDYFSVSEKDYTRNPGPLFSGSFYISRNPDTHSLHPLLHYIEYGLREGRQAFRPSTADSFMLSSQDCILPRIDDYLVPGQKVVILYWSDGNFFFTDIAKYILQVLLSKGIDVELLNDHRMVDLETLSIVVVAPHEYCVHGPGTELPRHILEKIVFVNTEQWQTSWFSLALNNMLISKRAVDINPLSARGLRRLGINAGFLPLLPSAGTIFDFKQKELSEQTTRLRSVKPLTFPSKFSQRPYDIMFTGVLNERRARELASLAPTLSQYDCFLHAPRLRGPIKANNPNMIDNSDIAQISQNAKILLNIHQGDSHYFEWHRLVLSGIAHGCVPITEACADIGIVKAGEHYIAASTAEMPEKISWLLKTAAGNRKLLQLHENGRVLMLSLQRTYMS